MRGVALALLLATPTAASSDVVAGWRDLHARCADAVEAGAMLDVTGLEGRRPTLIAEVVDEAPFGVRIAYDALRTSARTVPTGIWGRPGGRFEMQLLEFTTRAGTRAICEVSVARGARALASDEADMIVAAFGDLRETSVASGAFEAEAFDATTTGMTSAARNPRGCPVVASLTFEPASGYFRSSVAERVGAPECGGPSLAMGGLTRTPASLNPRTEP